MEHLIFSSLVPLSPDLPVPHSPSLPVTPYLFLLTTTFTTTSSISTSLVLFSGKLFTSSTAVASVCEAIYVECLITASLTNS